MATPIQENTAALQSLLEVVNALPEPTSPYEGSKPITGTLTSGSFYSCTCDGLAEYNGLTITVIPNSTNTATSGCGISLNSGTTRAIWRRKAGSTYDGDWEAIPANFFSAGFPFRVTYNATRSVWVYDEQPALPFTMADYVVEKGTHTYLSNTYTYEKWNSGKLVVDGVFTAGLACGASSGSLYWNGSPVTIYFDIDNVEFVTMDNVTVTIQTQTTTNLFVTCVHSFYPTNKASYMRAYINVNVGCTVRFTTTETRNIHYHVVGTWK